MKIAIVGGGLAGISAAYRLLEDSRIAQVHLFEASGRYGGRAHTDSTSIRGFAFDLGAQYIQDPDINPLTGIARQLGFKTIEEDSDALSRVQDSDGIWKNEPVTEPSVQEAVAVIEASYRVARKHPNVIVAGKPPVDWAAEALGRATSPYGPFTESAETWQYLAADRNREKAGGDQKNLFVERGIGTLVSTYGHRLVQMHPVHYVEHLNAKVTGIAHDDRHVRLHFGDEYFDAQACVVTVPVSVLQHGEIRFVPGLPEGHKDALRALRLGSYKKIALRLRKSPYSIVAGINYYLLHEAQARGEPEGVWQYYRLPHAPDVLVAPAAGDFAQALDALTDSEVYNLFKNDIQEACDEVFFTTGKVRDQPAAGSRFQRGAAERAPGHLQARLLVQQQPLRNMKGFDTEIELTRYATALRSQGYDFVMRYYSHHAAKNLSFGEAKSLSAAGLQVGVVWESMGTCASFFTRTQGVADGGAAYHFAKQTIGQPAGSAIYFAVDYDAGEGDISGAVSEYFAGVQAAFNAASNGGQAYQIGVYGSGNCCETLLSKGLASFTWLSQSTRFLGSAAFAASKKYNLIQQPTQNIKLSDGTTLSIDPDLTNDALPNGLFTV